MPAPLNATLTTAQLAQRSGVSAGTLRMWETRHGFPVPERLPGGHHRYREHDVETVREVLRLREQGLSLGPAIDRVGRAARLPPASAFAGLRSLRPELQPLVMSKPALLALTHALEDEYCSRGGGGVLIASFQRERFYRASQRRWRELARTAELAVVLADFPSRLEPASGPVEVPVGDEHPLRREWILIINAPQARACLAAWEQPSAGQVPDGSRRFEALWSFEPEVVVAATGVATDLIGRLAPDLTRRLPRSSEEPVGVSSPELRFGASLAHRAIGNLAARLDG